jgi:hypothetical protein
MTYMLRLWRALLGVAVRLRATAGRHRPSVWLLWTAGTIVLLTCPVAISDPGVLMFVLDPELLALIVVSSIALLRPAAADLIARALRASIRRTAGRAVAAAAGHGGRWIEPAAQTRNPRPRPSGNPRVRNPDS